MDVLARHRTPADAVNLVIMTPETFYDSTTSFCVNNQDVSTAIPEGIDENFCKETFHCIEGNFTDSNNPSLQLFLTKTMGPTYKLLKYKNNGNRSKLKIHAPSQKLISNVRKSKYQWLQYHKTAVTPMPRQRRYRSPAMDISMAQSQAPVSPLLTH